MLGRQEGTITGLLAQQLKGQGGDRHAAANELLTVLGKSARIGEVKQVLENFVEQRTDQDEREHQQDQDYEAPLASQPSDEEQDDLDPYDSGLWPEEETKEPVSRATVRRNRESVRPRTIYSRAIPNIVHLPLQGEEAAKRSKTSKQALELREGEILGALGLGAGDLNQGFSYELVLGGSGSGASSSSSSALTIRPDKVAQLLVNTSEGVAAGVSACGPTEALLLVALLSLLYLRNPFVKQALELVRSALAFDRPALLRRLPELLKLFLMREDLTLPEGPRLAQLEHWLRLVVFLLQNESAPSHRPPVSQPLRRQDTVPSSEEALGLDRSLSVLSGREEGVAAMGQQQ